MKKSSLCLPYCKTQENKCDETSERVKKSQTEGY